jgi:membrane fusion protein, multidrug efflux system
MSLNRKSALKWLAGLTIVLLIGFAVTRTLAARQAQTQALAAQKAAKDLGLAELAATDVVKAQNMEISQGAAVSGALRAVNSAVVKARVPGELQGLQVREGDTVKAGQVLGRIDASELQLRVTQAREQAQSAKAQVDVAQRQFDNNKALVDQGFISKTALDTSLANLNAARATYNAARSATDVAAKSAADAVLTAPISGQVSQRMAQNGERVGIDTRVVEIVDSSRLELDATLSALEASQARVGQTAELMVEGSSVPFTAKIARINPSAQAGSRGVLVYLSIDNSAPAGEKLALRQGLFAQGTLGLSKQMLLAVPVSAVRIDKPAPYVLTIEDNRVAHKPVVLGARGTANGEAVVAVTGLADGAQVIRANVGSLNAGTPVRFTPGMVGTSSAANTSSAAAAAKAP